MVSITSKQGVKAFFRGDTEVVIQYGAMEFSVQVGANMKIKCNGTLEIEAGAIKITAQRDVDIQARGATNIDSTQNVISSV